MLMNYQFESGQAITAEFIGEMVNVKNEVKAPSHEIQTFGLSSKVWTVMFASYVFFFGALIIATGHDSAAIFALVISIAYSLMYFGTAAVLNTVSAGERKTLSVSDQNEGIETQTGWMNNSAVNAQILSVPILLAVFACGFAIIRSFV